MLAVVNITCSILGMMCQGLLWIEFVMASTRVASVSFRLKRVRRFLSISMISYVALATLLLVLALGGFWSAEALLNAISGSIATSVGIIFLYGSYKMAAQHSQRERLLSSAPQCCPQRVGLWSRLVWPLWPHTHYHHHYTLTGQSIRAHDVEHKGADCEQCRERVVAHLRLRHI